MSAQGTTLARRPDDGAMVDAYVDALLAVPMPPAPPAAEPPPSPPADAAPEVHAHPEAGLPVDAHAGVGSEDAMAWPDDEPAPESAPQQAPVPAANRPAGAPGTATQAPQQAMPPPRAPSPVQPPVDAAEDTPATTAPVGQRWLRVAVGDDRYAVELLRVQEVVRLAPVIAVRGAAPSLLGVMNLRGRVVPVHDLGRWLRRTPVQADERARIVVLEHQDELVGLLVTAVTDVVTLDAPQIEPPTRGLRDRIGMGIARTPGAPPTVLLDARVVFD